MGRVVEVLRAFALLGVTSFGGPIAHLGYFREAFVVRRQWLRDDEYADLVALCQVLPGPTSSQVGFALGLRRAGILGALTAFLAFTLPSAAVMVAAAYGAAVLAGPIAGGAIHGLEIVAVAVVAVAVWGMAKTLAPDARRAGIAAVAAAVVLIAPGALAQLVAIGVGAAAGALLCRRVGAPLPTGPVVRISTRVGVACLAAFAAVMIAAPVFAAATGAGGFRLFDAFSRAGALVFGGGHVVLPLLEGSVVQQGWVPASDFLAGYGLAQAVPGPLFTFAGYLGALSDVGPGGVAGAVIALVAIFLPGFLLLIGAMPFWAVLRARPWTAALLHGIGAAVVGILAAALFTPLATTALTTPGSFALALVCGVLLTAFRMPPWAVVLIGAAGGIALTGV